MISINPTTCAPFHLHQQGKFLRDGGSGEHARPTLRHAKLGKIHPAILGRLGPALTPVSPSNAFSTGTHVLRFPALFAFCGNRCVRPISVCPAMVAAAAQEEDAMLEMIPMSHHAHGSLTAGRPAVYA